MDVTLKGLTEAQIMSSTANLAFAPTHTNGVYSILGVDFLTDPDLAEGLEPTGRADFIEWIEARDQDSFDLDAADEILRGRGYRRVEEWDVSLPDYAQARIERA